MSTTDERKFAFLGSKDPEISNKILDFFIKLGASNTQKLLCRSEVVYYFIDKTNKIYNSPVLPKGYIFQLHNYLNIMKNQEDKIPEYVECIEEQPQHNNYGELGKIYKVLDWNCSITDCMLVGTTSGSTAKKRFKPSTKEAYEAQNTYLKAAEYTPQEGDYVVMEKAGGWGYSPDNNGCIALVSRVGKNKVDRNEVFSIWGEVINPNKDHAVKFSGIPQFVNKEVIFRKALPHEIPSSEAFQFSNRLPQFEASPTAAVSEGPLEICRRKYKRGMKVKSAKEYGEYSGEFIIDVDPSEFTNTGSGVDYFASKGWLYIGGKFADILEEPLTRENKEFHLELERRTQYPITPENAFPVKALRKQLKIVNFQLVHEIKTVEEKLLKKTKSKLFNI